MKRSEISKLIKECYEEVISEDAAAVASAKAREKQEKMQWLTARKTSTDAELNDLRNSKTLSETDLEEMARIPTLYNLAPDINPEDYTGTNKAILQYLKDNPGKTKMEIAKGIGKNAQQAVNMIVKAMEEKGLIDSQGLAAEPKYKPSDGLGTGLRGRKLSPAGAKKRAIQSVYDKLMAGDEDAITFEEDDLIGADGMAKIKALVAQGGVKRGRKPVEKSDEEEFEMTDQNDDDLAMYSGDEEDTEDADFEIVDEPEINDEPSIEDEEPVISNEEPEDDELMQLINKKDELLSQLRDKKIDLSKYKELIGDIPQRIKALQTPEEDDEENDSDFIRERMQRIANIK